MSTTGLGVTLAVGADSNNVCLVSISDNFSNMCLISIMDSNYFNVARNIQPCFMCAS